MHEDTVGSMCAVHTNLEGQAMEPGAHVYVHPKSSPPQPLKASLAIQHVGFVV